jgi:hypothetical protein
MGSSIEGARGPVQPFGAFDPRHRAAAEGVPHQPDRPARPGGHRSDHTAGEEYFLDLGYELPESEPTPEPLAAEETMLIPRLTPSRDYSLKDEVARDLDRKLSDLETWMLLLSRYGSANLLISSINSDLAILNRPDRLDYVQEF